MNVRLLDAAATPKSVDILNGGLVSIGVWSQVERYGAGAFQPKRLRILVTRVEKLDGGDDPGLDILQGWQSRPLRQRLG